MSVLNLETLVVRLAGDPTNFNLMMRNAEQRIMFAATRFSGMGAMLTSSIGIPLTYFSYLTVRQFARFDDAITRSMSIMKGATDETRKHLEQRALDIASTSVTGPSQLAEAYYSLSSAGLTAKQSIEALDTVNKFAIAGMIDQQRAVKYLATSQAALGMKTEDAEQNMKNMREIADLLTAANNFATGAVVDYSEALTNKAGAAMRRYNVDLKEGMATLMAFHEAGIQGRKAGDWFHMAQRDIQRAAIKNAEIWEKLGVKAFDPATGKAAGLVSVLRQLEARMGPLSDEAKAIAFQLLGFTDRSSAALNTLLDKSHIIVDFQKKLEDAGGTLEMVAEKAMASFSSQMLIMRNNIEVAMIGIGKAVAPGLVRVNNAIREGMQAWNSLNPAIREVITNATLAYGALGLLAASIRYLPAIIGTLLFPIKAALGLIVSLFSVVFSWAGVIVAALALLGFAIYKVVEMIIGPEGMAKAWEQIKESVSSTVNTIIGFLYNFRENVGIIWEWIKSNWQNVLMDMVQAAGLFAINVMKPIGNMITRLVVNVFAWLKLEWRNLIGDFINVVWNFSKNVVTIIWEMARAISGPVLGWLRDNWEDLLTDLTKNFLTGSKNMVNNFRVMTDILVRALTAFTGWIVPKITDAFLQAFIIIPNLLHRMLTVMANAVIDWAKENASRIAAALRGDLAGAAAPVGDNAGAAAAAERDVRTYYDALIKDFKGGQADLGATLENIWTEESKRFIDPTTGMKWTVSMDTEKIGKETTAALDQVWKNLPPLGEDIQLRTNLNWDMVALDLKMSLLEAFSDMKPLEGFVSSVKELPKLSLKIPEAGGLGELIDDAVSKLTGATEPVGLEGLGAGLEDKFGKQEFEVMNLKRFILTGQPGAAEITDEGPLEVFSPKLEKLFERLIELTAGQKHPVVGK